MLSPVEQALQTLLPTTNAIPVQVSSLASSLLAQSKHAAPTLKADEEIARTYTCCHIACERLANKLTLDLGKLNPPCGPRVYKKLHAFLDGVLTAGTASQPATPRTNRTVDALPKTPVSASKFRTPVKSRLEEVKASVGEEIQVIPTTSAKRKRQAGEDAVPPAVVALSQHACKCMQLPQAVPHMYAGLESVWSYMKAPASIVEDGSASKRQRRQSAKAKTTAVQTVSDSIDRKKAALVVLAMFHEAYAVMRGEQLTAVQSQKLLDDSITFLGSQEGNLVIDEPETVQASIDGLSEQLQTLPAWHEWHDNLPQLDAHDVDDDLPVKTPIRPLLKRGTADEEDTPGAAGLLPGLGTMFQPAYDWLSDQRRADYATWAKGIMQRIATMEQKT